MKTAIDFPPRYAGVQGGRGWRAAGGNAGGLGLRVALRLGEPGYDVL